MARSSAKKISEGVSQDIKEIREILKEEAIQMKELRKFQKETARQMKETDRQMKETDRQMKETDRQMKETDRKMKETDRKIDKTMRSIDKTNGNFNTKWGNFLEKLIEGDLVRLLNQRNIQVANTHSRVRFFRGKHVGAEYDLIAVNGSEIVVFEVKTTLGVKDIYTFLEELKKVRERFPEYRDKKIFGGMAYMNVDKESDKLCMDEGLFLIQAPGGVTKISTLRNPKNFVPKSF